MLTINKKIPYKITGHNKKLFSAIQPEEKGNKVIETKMNICKQYFSINKFHYLKKLMMMVLKKPTLIKLNT